ncbi:MAG: PadR family transcriptional regulator, partial [Sciscionella sp.]
GMEPGFGRGGGRGHGRGGRRRKGNVRAAVLALLTERAMHGYEMIQEITERSGGFWRPSPGSVYPTLQLLADEGLVESDESGGGGRKLFTLTDTGRAEAEKSHDAPPWEEVAGQVDPNEVGLRSAAGQLTAAVMQVSLAASSAQKERAAQALNEARHQLYLILAEAGVAAGTEAALYPEAQDGTEEEADDE